MATPKSAGDVIREAENLISAGRYEYALQQLSTAQKLEPENAYIRAIMERVSLLLRQQQQMNNISQRGPAGPFDERVSRYLSVTVGAEFKDGIKSDSLEESLSPREVEERVKRLTSVAVNLFRRGSYDTAFDSLMKAYLLDPTNSHVMACERILLPAIELMRKRSGFGAPASQSQEDPSPAASQAPPPPEARASDEERLALLKQQKELQRTEKEREMWRAASRAPRNQPTRDDRISWSNPDAPPPSPKQSGGLFSKLRQGKFLG